MKKTVPEKIATIEKRLADIYVEQQRQAQWAGERFGVLKRLRELESEERRQLRRLDRLLAPASQEESQ